MENENKEALTVAAVTSERLRDPDTGQFLAKPSEVYIESRQRNKELLTKQLQDLLQSPASDLEPLDTDSVWIAALKRQLLNAAQPSEKTMSAGQKMVETVMKTCGMQEMAPVEVNHGVRIVIIQPPPNMMNKESRPYAENRPPTPAFADILEVRNDYRNDGTPAPPPAAPVKTPEEQRKAKYPWTEL